MSTTVKDFSSSPNLESRESESSQKGKRSCMVNSLTGMFCSIIISSCRRNKDIYIRTGIKTEFMITFVSIYNECKKGCFIQGFRLA